MNLDAPAGDIREGRVVSSHGRDAVVEDPARRRIRCRLQGRRLSAVCGDRVRWIAAHGDGAEGLITAVLPRATELARLNLRGQAEPIAANLTQLVAVIAPMPPPDLGLCDRYLAAAEWAGLKACVAGNKSDLAGAQDLLAPVLELYAALELTWVGRRPEGWEERHLQVERMPFEEAVRRIGDGRISDAKTQVALLAWKELLRTGLVLEHGKEGTK